MEEILAGIEDLGNRGKVPRLVEVLRALTSALCTGYALGPSNEQTQAQYEATGVALAAFEEDVETFAAAVAANLPPVAP